MEDDGRMKGMVMNIQKFCLQDGPGIRTTVFLKGCNMKCAWCHNPESISPDPELLFYEEKCTGCQRCMQICPGKVHSFAEEEGRLVHRIDRKKCTGCGACAESCLNGALEIAGKQMDTEEVMEEIRKDKKYYSSSGGGVTLSGGEASCQMDFVMELFGLCRQEGIHTALETNGLIAEVNMRKLMTVTDLFLYDYKVTGEEEYRRWTGATGQISLQNLERIDRAGGTVYLRCPVIPGVNDSAEHFAMIRELQRKYPCIKKAEIMAYHDTGKGKWKECGKTYAFPDLKTVSGEQKELWQQEITL